jgi:hypothetical protein
MFYVKMCILVIVKKNSDVSDNFFKIKTTHISY